MVANSSMADYRDWDPVVFRKAPTGGGTGEKAASAARQKGSEVETMKKFTQGNKHGSSAVADVRKLEADDDGPPQLPTVTLDLRLAIQKARQAKGWNQKELATAINEKPGVINEYESGRAVPNGQIIAKMEKVLGAKLPRPPKKKAAAEE